MSMMRRRAIMQGEQGGGDNVNYVTALIGDGASWVSTEVLPKATTSFQVRFVKTWNKVQILFGVGSNQFVFLTNSSIRADFGGKMQSATFSYGSTIHEVYIDVNTLMIDGISITPSWSSFSTPNNYITLFGKNNGQAPNYSVESGTIANATVYEFIVAESGVEVSHLRPALDPDGIPCMYDTVRKVYQYNKGSGSFDYIP